MDITLIIILLILGFFFGILSSLTGIGGGVFFVVWQELSDSNGFNIKGVRLDSNGNILDIFYFYPQIFVRSRILYIF